MYEEKLQFTIDVYESHGMNNSARAIVGSNRDQIDLKELLKLAGADLDTISESAKFNIENPEYGGKKRFIEKTVRYLSMFYDVAESWYKSGDYTLIR